MINDNRRYDLKEYNRKQKTSAHSLKNLRLTFMSLSAAAVVLGFVLIGGLLGRAAGGQKGTNEDLTSASGAATIGSILHIKPVLVCRGGKFEPQQTVRGTKNCMKKTIEAMQKEAEELEKKGYHLRYGCAGSFSDPENGLKWKEQVEEAFPGKDIWYDPLSLVVCAHTGPDAFGVGVSVAYERD